MMGNRQGWRRITMLAIGYGAGLASALIVWLAFAAPSHAPTCEIARKVLFTLTEATR